MDWLKSSQLFIEEDDKDCNCFKGELAAVHLHVLLMLHCQREPLILCKWSLPMVNQRDSLVGPIYTMMTYMTKISSSISNNTILCCGIFAKCKQWHVQWEKLGFIGWIGQFIHTILARILYFSYIRIGFEVEKKFDKTVLVEKDGTA